MKEKKQDKTFVVAVSIVVIILVVLLFVMFILPRISARVRLQRVLSGFEGAEGSDAVEVTDPKYDGGLLPTSVSAVLYTDDATSLSQRIIEITGGAKYREKRVSLAGSWDISVSLRTDDGVFTLYFDEEELYVANDVEQYIFVPSEKSRELYSDLYRELENIIAQSANKG